MSRRRACPAFDEGYSYAIRGGAVTVTHIPGQPNAFRYTLCPYPVASLNYADWMRGYWFVVDRCKH